MTPAKKRKYLTFQCLPLHQGKHKFFCLTMKASTLWSIVSINKRDSDKDKGYQRALSTSRVASISKYIKTEHRIPNSILISFDKSTKVLKGGTEIKIPLKKDAGWVIDGQHRLAGAHESNTNIDVVVIAFIGLKLEEQIEEFVTINKEAKGVPTSLYYDLLKKLPSQRTDTELAKERSVDLADILKKDEESPFGGRIVVVTSPRRGEISLTNFVRKISPLVSRKNGKFNLYTPNEQVGILDNYFKALENVFPQHFDNQSLFFQTLGFGAIINALPTVFDLSMKNYQTFTVKDVTKILKSIDNFSFEDWKNYGTGSAAEIQAGDDIRQSLLSRLEGSEEAYSIRL